MVETVICVAAKVAEYMVDPICRHLSYLFKHHHHVDGLIQQIGELNRARVTVGNSVEVARRQGGEIFPHVEVWLQEAEGIIQRQEGFAEDEKQASKSCFSLKSRYRLSQKAEKQALDIGLKLQQAREFGDRVARCPPLPPLISSAFSQNCEAFPSRHSIFDQIMEALRNEETSKVGVWGMGGVGKTTLTRQVAKRAEEEKLFRKVVMASSISKTPDISEIQSKIARTLGLTFPEGENRAVRLMNNLKNQETILVILDDIWGELDLEKIGIPCGDDHKGCKLLLTSRDRRVLDSDMKAQQVFHLPHLNAEEAWNLFKSKAGDSLESPEIRPIADEIVKHCEGLPVAIVTIAEALKKNSVPEWKNALDELKMAAPTNLRGVSEKVYSCLELSYKHLESGEAKSLLLLCGLLEDAHISMDRLLPYCMGLNLFEGLYSWEKATNKVITLVEGLKASSLLLDPDQDGNKGGYRSLFFDDAFVKMHDVVRDVARSIASKDACQYVVREAAELTAALSYSRISLECGDMDELPQRLGCPELKLFLLNSRFNGQKVMRIPDDFFQGLTKLRVVHLSGVSLGPSLGCLSNLRALCLNKCQLQDMPIVGELTMLQTLSLADSNIEELPKEMKQLRDLRVLDLRDCRGLRIIPRDVISSLSRLEYLSLEGCRRIEWKRDGVNRSGEINKACLSEIKHLRQLKTLEVQISDASLLPDVEMLFHKNVNLSRYSILIGEQWPRDKYSKSLQAADVKSLEVLLNGFSQLYKSVQDLRVRRLNDIKDVVYELDMDHHGFVELKNLAIWECPNIEYILDSRRDHQWVPPCNTLSMLENLSLVQLDNLEAVCHGPIPEGCFRNLRDLKLEGCKRLKYVFASSQYPTIELAFPHLQSLEMSNLPELISFFYSTTTTTTEVRQDRIPIFNRQVSFPALESLTVNRLINTQALWEKQPAVANSFFKVKELNIRGCHKLHNVFPLCVAKALLQLENLEIFDCDGVETIVADEEENESAVVSPPLILFPKITRLQLIALPQLKRFCSSTMFTLRWPALESLAVHHCNQVEVLFQGLRGPNEGDQQLIDITTIQQPLFLVDQSLTVEEMINTQPLWEKQLAAAADSFSKVLSRITIFGCYKLQNVFPLCVAKALVQLEYLAIYDCGVIEIIVVDEEEEEDEPGVLPPIILFPKVTHLELRILRQLKRFNSGRFTLRWPALKSLKVYGCNQVEVLFQRLIGPNEGDQQLIHITTFQQPLFLVDKDAFPSLESISISHSDSMRALWYSPQISADFFPRLKELDVNSCGKLLNVFPLSVAKSLGQLQQLQIGYCKAVEEIVTCHEDETTASLSLFPNLTTLILRFLPKLRKFCSKRFASRWPRLKSLELRECNKVEILFVQETSVEGGLATTEIQQPFFFLQKDAFPALESVSICHSDSMRALWYSPQISADFFPRLKELDVNSCGKLLNVFPLSLAKSLGQLQQLQIGYCKAVEEIVTSHEDETSASLSLFPNLTTLVFRFLPKLRKFCSKRFASRWPRLKSLELRECNKVEILFVQETSEEGGLAATEIQQPFFFLRKDAFPALESIFIYRSDSMRALWYSPKISADSFPRLKELDVNSCHKLLNVFPLSVAKALGQLERLEIESCEGVEEIVTCHEDEKAASLSLFPNLTTLVLRFLPKLQKFCSKKFASRWPRLKSLELRECNKVEILFVQETSVEGGLAATEIQQPFFFLRKEAFPNLETLTIINLEGVVEIWPGQFSGVSFSKLIELTIEQCHCISTVIPMILIEALHNLESLKVKGCDSLNEVIQVVDGESPTYDEIDFPILERLELEDLPNLKSFCSTTSSFQFPSLKHVEAKKCPKMELFCKGDLQTPMLKYEEMGDLLRQYWETNLNTTIQLIRQAHLQGTIMESESDFSF